MAARASSRASSRCCGTAGSKWRRPPPRPWATWAARPTRGPPCWPWWTTSTGWCAPPALRGLHALVERGRAGDLDTLEQAARGFALTATDFRPEFTIRTSYGRLIRAIGTKRSAA